MLAIYLQISYKLAMRVMAKIYVVVFALAVLLAIAANEGRFFGYPLNGGNTDTEMPAAFTLDEAKLYLPGAVSLRVTGEDAAEVLDLDRRRIGRLLHTQPQARHIIGYGSWLPLVVVFNSQDRIVGLVLQPHQESPDFIARLAEQKFFESWNGLSASEAVALNVDAVSRAT
ncbi:MAG: hypothetical protein ACD_39C01693G0001, partial [uncultured bacterium]